MILIISVSAISNKVIQTKSLAEASLGHVTGPVFFSMGVVKLSGCRPSQEQVPGL